MEFMEKVLVVMKKGIMYDQMFNQKDNEKKGFEIEVEKGQGGGESDEDKEKKEV